MTEACITSAQRDDGVAVVTLDRPPVNAIDQALYRDIKTVFEDLGKDDSLRCIVLRSEGKHFCGGNDLEAFKTLTPENSPERMLEVREAFWAIHDCAVPVIAAVQGTAVGTGCALVASCDFAVAAEGARIGVPEIGVGVMGGGRHLSRLLPQPLVRWMFFSGEPARVEDLLAFGAVVAVVPASDLLGEALSRARAIARHSPVAVRFAKRALNDAESMDLKGGYETEQRYTTLLSGYRDSKEAVAAFFERRPPRYTGR